MDQIIVRMPNWVGDLVMATPVLTDLRKAFPKAQITAMCRRGVSELLEKDKAIDELFSFEKVSNEFSRREDARGIIEKIREGKFDCGILLTNSFSSAWWFWQGHVKKRIGYVGHFRSLLLTTKLERDPNVHHVIAYKRLLAPLGVAESTTMPRIHLDEMEVKESKQLLYNQGYQEGKTLIGINPGASYGSAKCWPPERFKELAKRLLEERDLFVVFFGTAEQSPLVKSIARGLPERVIDLCGSTNLRELSAIISDLDVLVTNDSGPMHIGAAFNVPLVALFGSTDDKKTGPFGQGENVINKRVKCSPCMKRTCPIDFRCMHGISVDEVLEKVLAHV